ncbi:serine hydrolase [Roseivirga sp. E12]|uniref:serine hydrolase domain-containing protein n=1 Tax=Roseivirga sp. E12 TaxID=2819237 RepID=UPI001ABD469A|nr:serine hydrolase [Roseivirga sp. E12]MBO3700638.1 serine hydrolase [Roseivirga sp. E12]
MKKLFAFLTITLGLLSCSESSSPEYRIELVSQGNVLGFQGATLPQPIIAKVVSESGEAQSGIDVIPFVKNGGGFIESASTTSDANGLVTVNWQLGEALSQGLQISLKDNSKVFVTVTARAKYSYKQPATEQDGWIIGDVEELSDEQRSLIFNGIDRLRNDEFPEVHSVVVMHKRKLVLEEYYDGTDSNGNFIEWDRFTKHEIQSASKSFRSMLVGIAIEKGFVEGVDVPFYSFFPAFDNLKDEEQKGEITLDHVLTMSAGFDWDEWSFPFGHASNNLSTMYAMPSSQWVPYVLGLPMKYVPGSTFAYSTGTSLMLANVISNSIDTDLRSFTREYYSDLVEGTPVNDPNGNRMTPREMAKMGYLYLYDGKWKDNQVVSTDWIEKSITPRFENINTSGGYGYQWWLKTFSTSKKGYDCYYASGNGGQFVVVNKELDLVVVFTGGNFGSAQMFDILNWMEDHIFSAYE